ncbi:MAG: tryptophan-rich sensory protein [Nanoarchaeota archaeon]|nr:tryptophan-rich sensory protein [Nanoarchaeota archaeon]
MKINWKVLVVCLVLTFAVGFVGSLFTSPNTGTDWYNSIKPTITPPNFVFPVVWNVIFLLIAISLYLVWISSKKKDKPKILLVFGVNFILNVLWSLIFFELRLPLVSFFELILLFGSVIWMILVTKKINKVSSWLLVPYLLWLIFAGILNFLIAF